MYSKLHYQWNQKQKIKGKFFHGNKQHSHARKQGRNATAYKKIKLKNREGEWEREKMIKKQKKTSKLLSSCSRRLSSARIRCFPLLSLAVPAPTATVATRSSSSTNDGVSDSISQREPQMELQTNTGTFSLHPHVSELTH